MKKIGILTFFIRNYNYGGQLQSYALQRVLQLYGYEAEQICYNGSSDRQVTFREKKRVILALKHPLRVIKNRVVKPFLNKKLVGRRNNFNAFKEIIPHSSIIYDNNTISDANKVYDVFICGSDQIWKDWGNNSETELSNYLLSFVDKDKPRLSYAVSLGVTNITRKYSFLLKRELPLFKAISVREKSAVDILGKYVDAKVYEMPDPVLLLDCDEWKEIARRPKIISKNVQFIFCYFLSDDNKMRKVVEKYAAKTKFKIVTIPYALHHSFFKEDLLFGDYRDFYAGPREFLWYINHANVVLTDSFHAMVFSTIFHKDFFVFLRNKKGEEMNNRIMDYLSNYNLENRIVRGDINEKEILDYKSFDNLILYQRKSAEIYLKENID